MHLAIDASNIRQGGGVTHLSQLLNVANPQQHGIKHISIWTCESTAVKLPKQAWLTVIVPEWSNHGLIKRLIRQHLFLRSEIAKRGCNILFSPGGTVFFNNSLPVVTMSQNMLPFESQEAKRFGFWSLMRLKMWLLRQAQSRSFRQADGLIYLTQYAQRVISKSLGISSKLNSLIPHGVEARFLQSPRPSKQLSEYSTDHPFRMLYVSILMPYKHQVALALAVSQIRAGGFPIEMKFVGASWGNYGKFFSALLAKLDPQRKFLHWFGEESFEALHHSYINADAFVFASSCENLPNILIEAMAAGLPIASSNRGPMPEVLGEAGIYFDPEIPSSIEEALRELMSNAAQRQQLAKLAWQKAQTYSWERCAKDTFDFIAHVAQKHVRS
jgi:glycosyltransferase involved in cell wall biosynthesis